MPKISNSNHEMKLPFSNFSFVPKKSHFMVINSLNSHFNDAKYICSHVPCVHLLTFFALVQFHFAQATFHLFLLFLFGIANLISMVMKWVNFFSYVDINSIIFSNNIIWVRKMLMWFFTFMWKLFFLLGIKGKRCYSNNRLMEIIFTVMNYSHLWNCTKA